MKLKGDPFVSMLLIMILALASVLGFVHFASAHPPPPTITFKGLNETGCKIFEIGDNDGIKEVKVSSGILFVGEEQITEPASERGIKPTNNIVNNITTYSFNYPERTLIDNITVCPKGVRADTLFDITATDSQGLIAPALFVHEQRIKANVDNTFSTTFAISKPLDQIDRDNVTKSLKTDNLNNVKVEFERGFTEGSTVVKVTGKLINVQKPGTVALTVDPQADLFLLVVEVVPAIPVPVFPGNVKAVAVAIVAAASFLLVKKRFRRGYRNMNMNDPKIHQGK